MPAGRVSMRHVREILRLGCSGISKHEIGRRMGLAASTVRETLKRFAATGLPWPLPDDVTDGFLEARLYKSAGTKQGHRRIAEPDWALVHRELKRKHVTLSILCTAVPPLSLPPTQKTGGSMMLADSLLNNLE